MQSPCSSIWIVLASFIGAWHSRLAGVLLCPWHSSEWRAWWCSVLIFLALENGRTLFSAAHVQTARREDHQTRINTARKVGTTQQSGTTAVQILCPGKVQRFPSSNHSSCSHARFKGLLSGSWPEVERMGLGLSSHVTGEHGLYSARPVSARAVFMNTVIDS